MIRKIFVLIFFLFLFTNTLRAERLDLGETTTIVGNQVTLINIGSYGSAVLNIENKPEPLIIRQYGEPVFVDGFQIKIINWRLEPDGNGYIEYELIKGEIKCNTDLDCHDNNICTIDSCNKNTNACLNLGKSCELNGACFSEGARLNDSKTYCKENYWYDQKTLNENCDNNYECSSNNCFDNKCTGFLVGNPVENNILKLTGHVIGIGDDKNIGLIFIFLGIILSIGGLFFIIRPKRIRKFFSPFKQYSIKLFRILGFILIAIGFLFILFYLT